jgi:hypothetical protein
MRITQNIQPQGKFVGGDELAADTSEKSRQLDDDLLPAIVNIIMSVLFLGATGCLARAVVLIFGKI